MISNLFDLKYEGGYPTVETIQKLYDQLDVQRAAQAYLDFMPAMSMQAVLDAHPRDYRGQRDRRHDRLCRAG